LFFRLGDTYDYMVAWVDALPGSGFGRSIVFGANPIPTAEAHGLPPYRHADAKLGSSLRLLAPFFNGVSIYALNELFYRVKKRERDALIGIQPAWFPWDSIPQWNKLYAPRGFVEYQVMIPYDGALGTYTAILEEVRQNGSQHKVYFAALKRMRKSAAPLAFCLDGFSLLMDFGVRPGVWEALDRLDRIVADAGGRVFLAKDGRLGKEMFRNMYPEWRRWAELRAQLDPEGRIMSDMGRRLGLDLS
jgi:decaprenylphospho-beta-D-ribofuranose 2-oxidase